MPSSGPAPGIHVVHMHTCMKNNLSSHKRYTKISYFFKIVENNENSIKVDFKPGMLLHTCNSSTQEVKPRGWRVQMQWLNTNTLLQNKVETKNYYIQRPSLLVLHVFKNQISFTWTSIGMIGKGKGRLFHWRNTIRTRHPPMQDHTVLSYFTQVQRHILLLILGRKWERKPQNCSSNLLCR